MIRFQWGLSGVWVVAAALVLGCGSGSSSSSGAQGTQGAPCYPNQTCNAGLSCANNRCASTAGGAGGNGGSTSGTKACYQACIAQTGSVPGCTQACGVQSGGGMSGGGVSGGGVSGGGPGGSGAIGGGVSSGGSGSGGGSAPIILSLSTNTDTLDSSAASVIISAVVTDPDGIGDLIGGTLLDPDTGSTYGTFATAAQEGAYSITLDWKAINTVRAINAPVGGGTRVLRAKFFDVAGHSTTGDVTIKFACPCYDFDQKPTICAVCNGTCWPTCDPCPTGMQCTRENYPWDQCLDPSFNLYPCVADQDCVGVGLTTAVCRGSHCQQFCWGATF